MDDDRDRERAKVRRSTWPIRVHRLGEEPGSDLSEITTPEERIAMVWILTREAWALAGKTIPGYRREEAPVTVVPLGSS